MSVAQYQGRRFDVLAFRGARASGEVQLSQTLFDEDTNNSIFDSVSGGEVCTGTQKLAQRWALEFLTERGSMPFHMATRGSSFMRNARQGRIRTEFDVHSFFNFAAQQVQTNLINEETDEMQDDERFDRAVLTRNTIFEGALQLYVTITSLAGDTAEVILPITIIPINISIG